MASTHIEQPEVWATAFGDRPGVSVALPRRADPRTRWAAAVALGGQGRFAAAAGLLSGLATDPGTPRALAAHAVITRASHLRQFGGQAAAAHLDGIGVRLATEARRVEPEASERGGDARSALIDGLVGLAADSVAAADSATAERLLSRVDVLAGDVGAGMDTGPRPVIRAGWVRAELALLCGDPAAAVRAAAGAVDGARRWGSARHLLKSRLVAEVARLVAVRAGIEDARPAAAGADTLDGLAAEAGALGLVPLRWAALAAAGSLLGCEPPVGSGEPSDPSGASDATNERRGRTAPESVNGAMSDAARQRHAAAHALSVVFTRSDPQVRELMREAV